MIILMWMIAAYGMTNILVYGSIFNGLRNWIHNNAQPNVGLTIFRPVFEFISNLIKCVLCTSTWVGFFLSLTLFAPWHEIIGLNKYISIFFANIEQKNHYLNELVKSNQYKVISRVVAIIQSLLLYRI